MRLCSLTGGLLALLVAGQASASGPVLYDPDYAYRPTGQRDWVRRRVRQILAPTITFPALVRLGGRFQIMVRVRRGPQLKRLEADQPRAWAVDLLPARSRGHAWPCRVLQVAPEGGRVVLTVAAPLDLARDVYDLSVVGPGVDDSQPGAVRVYGAQEPDRFRFAVIADHQLWDPSARLSGRALGGGFPRAKDEKDNLAVARQGFAELALWDPEFVLHLGDLVFGVNYPQEYDEAYDMLEKAALPLFGVPGNHDAYANYVVRLKEGALMALARTVGCRKHLSGDLSWKKAWVFITCVYGDVKHMLYADLHRDGLVFWQRQLGPPAYAFDHGQLRFVGINTYDGTPERRHAFSIYMDVFDLHLGAPAVDNYGGYLTDAQLAWIKAQARLASSRGQTLVVFGHHDPRGNEVGQRYHENESFPTDPISLAGFEQWNYDAKRWDSDPRDKRGAETSGRNSAHALLRILAEHGGYYLSGHVHKDARRAYEPGDRLPGGIRVKKRLEFIVTTTASASVRDDGYWGYRVIEVQGRRLTGVDYSPEHHMASVPSGNLWLERGKGVATVTSGLPRDLRPVVRWALPTRPEGYRFRLAAGGMGRGTGPAALEHPRVERVQPQSENTVYWVSVGLPAAPQPPTEHNRSRRVIRVLPARDNRPPTGVIDVSGVSGLELQPLEAGFQGAPGQPLLLSAERSSDPDGDRILAYRWELGDEHQARGRRVVYRFTSAGRRTVRLTLIDEAGARSTVAGVINIQPPRLPPPTRRGCGGCCTAMGGATLAPPALVLLALLLVRRWRRRR